MRSVHDVRACPECGDGIFEQTTMGGSLIERGDHNIATCSRGHRWWIDTGAKYEPMVWGPMISMTFEEVCALGNQALAEAAIEYGICGPHCDRAEGNDE